MLDFPELPKFELHVHLEGCIPRETLFQLQLKENPDLDFETFNNRFHFDHFGQFINLWCEHQSLLFQKESPAEVLPGILRSIASKFRQQNILYVEAHISPIDSLYMLYGKKGIRENSTFYQEVLSGWDQAVSSLNADEDMPVIKLIVDLVRNYPPEVFDWQVQCLERIAPTLDHVIGAGLGGGGTGKRLKNFREGFARLKALGMKTFAHAGELPPSHQAALEVRDALEIGVDRIGHGIHCFEDRELMEILSNEKVALEICPTSNLMTRSVSSMENHPLPHFMKAGVPFIINSDDPVYFSTDLNREYEIVQEVFDLSEVDLVQILRNSYQYSFAPDRLKSFAQAELTKRL